MSHSEGRGLAQIQEKIPVKESAFKIKDTKELPKQGIFDACKTFAEIKAVIKDLPPDKQIRRGNNKLFDMSLVELAITQIEAGAIIPARLMGVMTGSEGLRDALGRGVKSYFESDTAFNSLSTIDEIIKRFNNITAQNTIFSNFKDFNLPNIELTNSRNESLLTIEPGLGPDCKVVKLLKEIKNNISRGKEAVRQMEAYQKMTSKYGLQAAVDRSL